MHTMKALTLDSDYTMLTINCLPAHKVANFQLEDVLLLIQCSGQTLDTFCTLDFVLPRQVDCYHRGHQQQHLERNIHL